MPTPDLARRMRSLAWALPWALLFLPAVVRAGPGEGLTAQELFQRATATYLRREHAEALALYEAFERNYGRSEQAEEAMERLRVPVAICRLRVGKYAEALEAIDHALGSQPPIAREERAELLFWQAVCRIDLAGPAPAREALDRFLTEFPGDPKQEEAQLLRATTFLIEEDYAAAADAFAGIRERLSPSNRGRAVVLELVALVGGGDLAGARTRILAEFPRMEELVQIVLFQTLTLQVGASLLEAGEHRAAIQCLQRVWQAERLLEHQQRRLEELESRKAALDAQPAPDPYAQFQMGQRIAKVRRELETFREIPDFDAALRLRLATAFLAMERFREGALILEEMLLKMPRGPVVEGGAVTLVQSWMQIERWPKVREAAARFEKIFPASESLPLVLYLRGIAEQKEEDFGAAIATFHRLREGFPDSDFAARALFQCGFTEMLDQQADAAARTFGTFCEEEREHPLAESALYWQGMAFSLAKKTDLARERLLTYLERYPEGQHRGAATFRRAYCLHAARELRPGAEELARYLEEFPGHENNSEARILLGEALLEFGEMEAGIDCLRQIPPEEPRFFEEAWFTIAKAYRMSEDLTALQAHLQRFLIERPESPRVAEAVYWIGWVHRQRDDVAAARTIYWETIRRSGNDPRLRSVEDLFLALPKLYGEERAALEQELEGLALEASVEGQRSLACRALWARARLIQRETPEAARELLLTANGSLDVKWANPTVIADIAEAVLEEGEPAQAEQLFRDLLRWNPRAPEKDRALLALARISSATGAEAVALEFYERFRNEVAASTRSGIARLEHAALLGRLDRQSEARALLEEVLEDQFVAGEQKARALIAIARSYEGEGQLRQAFPYYQRVTILYTRWKPLVAEAYLRCGAILDALGDAEGARRTYHELLSQEELEPHFERPEVESEIARLDGAAGRDTL